MLEQTKFKIGEMQGGATMSRLIEQSRAAGQESRKRVARVTITLARVIEYIKEQGYDPGVENELVKMAKSRPQGALLGFANNLPKYLATAQKATLKDRVVKPELKIENLEGTAKEKHEAYKKTMQTHYKAEVETEANEDDALEKEMLQRLSAMTTKKYEPPKKAVAEKPEPVKKPAPKPAPAPKFQERPQVAERPEFTERPQFTTDDFRNVELRDMFRDRLNEVNGMEEEEW